MKGKKQSAVISNWPNNNVISSHFLSICIYVFEHLAWCACVCVYVCLYVCLCFLHLSFL